LAGIVIIRCVNKSRAVCNPAAARNDMARCSLCGQCATGVARTEETAMDRKEKKHDLRDDIYSTPISVTDIERRDPLGETPAPDIYDPTLVTPDPTKVPEGQTTKE
jgi:hypothetical protein